MKKVKTIHKSKETQPQVKVTDFSRAKIRMTIIVGLCGMILLAVFPYRSVSREHVSYVMLWDFYKMKYENMFYRDARVYDTLAPSGSATSIPTIMYHGVMRTPDTYNISREMFHEHLAALKQAGWSTITLEEFRAFKRGEVSVPEKSFVLTFDDGRKDSYYPVDPLLERFGYSAVMFTLPKFSIDHEEISPYYLNRSQIGTMHASDRWEIESHGWAAHSSYPLNADGSRTGVFYANRIWNQEENRSETPEEFRLRVREDLQRADTSIRNFTGKSGTTIAYPFGNYGASGYNFGDAQEIVLEESAKIHDYGFAQVRNGVFRGHGSSGNYTDDEFLIRRIDVNPLWSGADLVDVLEGGRDKELPFQASMDEYVGWIGVDGVMRHVRDGITLETTELDRSAVTFLDGGSLWSEYTFTANMKWPSGKRLSLRAYDKQNDPALECIFDDGQISVSTPTHTLAFEGQGNFDRADLDDTFAVSITRGEQFGYCAIGERIVSFEMPEELRGDDTHGTVGIEIFSDNGAHAKVELHDIAVSGRSVVEGPILIPNN